MATRNHAGRYVAVIAFLVLIVSGIFAFRGAGRWLVHEDPLNHADAILVLSGSMPYRAEEAAKVYREGYGPEVWLTNPQSPQSVLASMGIQYKTDEEYEKEVLIHSGVPESAIHLLPREISDTEQEIQGARDEMRKEGKSTVLIVTSPQHTRRVSTLWHKLVGASPKAIIHGAPEDPFNADRWWRNTSDSLAVVREYLGLLNAWTGLPVRPRSS
jgi:uncharacterized SAM-binding protein YcdF (DUF218 family)